MSLTSCMNRAGDALRAEDRRAIIDRAFALRKEGMPSAQASLQAVEERIAEVRSLVEAEERMIRGAEAPAAPTTIQDVGEKIGGARKDTATSAATRQRRASADDERPVWARRFQVSQIVKAAGQLNSPRDEGRWVIHDKRSTNSFGQPRQVGRDTYATKEEAEAYLPLAAVSLKHRAVPQRDGTYEIWRDISDRKRVKVVDQAFATRDEAMAYMVEHAVDIIETNTTFGEADIPLPPDRARSGPARRAGNVAGEDFKREFGFRGVEFGNWNNQDERQALMNEAWDGLLDLAEVLGVPSKALGLNGDLALAFGARGHGLNSARAHYELERAVINLTKEHGAGSLAHEWFHALDHYFGRQDGKASASWVVQPDGTRTLNVSSPEADMASGGFRGERSGVRPEVRAAYETLLKTMFKKAETYVEDTAKADQFTARAREDLAQALDSLRRELSAQKDLTYYKRNNKPASAEQLAEFDAIAKAMLDGDAAAVVTDWRHIPGSKAAIASRWTNDSLERLSVIHKAVRGRTGFDGSNRDGVLDRLRGNMERYSQRLKMLAEAQAGAEKQRAVPTDFAMNAKELDQGRGTDYWTTPHEMAARAFQAYVEDKIAERGGTSRFLTYGPANAGIPTPWGFKRPFPAGAERQAINAAFDKFTGVLQSREDDTGNVALFEPDPVSYTGPYETDLFGEPLPESARAARTARTGHARVHRDAQPITGLRGDTEAPQGDYSVRTVVGTTATRRLAVSSIRSPADAAAATRYLYRSAVERMDGIVTDSDGKPLAVVGGFKGTLNQTSVYPATLVGEAIRVPGAANIWFSHNHPSGAASLSSADERLASVLDDVFRGSGIEPRGLLAVGGGQFSHTARPGSLQDIPTRAGDVEVPVIERQLLDTNTSSRGAPIESPSDAASAASAYYQAARAPGLMLLDTQHRVAAWVPLPASAFGRLRDTGGLASLYRAVSEANAGAAILVHGGELSEAPLVGGMVGVAQNIGAALKKIDVNPLDVINAKTGESYAQAGRLTSAGPVFSRASSEGMSPELAQRLAMIRRPATVESVRAALRELVNGIGMLPNQLGRVVVTTSSEVRSEWEPLIGQVRLDSESAGAAMAFFDPKSRTVFLLADRIPAGQEQAVILHELMHKHGRAVLGNDGWNRMHSVIGAWADAPEGSLERRVHDEATARVVASLEDAESRAHSTEELFPYAVQAAIEMGVKPNLLARQGTVARWLGEVRRALRDVWAKVFGKAKADQFNAQDLVDLAFGIAQRENPAHWGELDDATRGAVPPPAVKVQVKQDGFPRFATDKVVIENPVRKTDLGVIETDDGGQLVTYTVRDTLSRAPIGKLDLLVKDGRPVSLINIAMTDRRGGGGRAVVEALLAANPDSDLNISNIVPEARGFWDRMGVPEQFQPDGDAYDGTINWRQFRDAQADRAEPAPDLDGVEARELSPEETADLHFARGGGARVPPGASAAAASEPAPRRRSYWLDAANRVQFAPGVWLYGALGRAADPMLTKLQLKAASPELRRQLRQMKLQVAKAQETAAAVASDMQALPQQEREMVSDIIERELRAGIVPPEHAVRLAATMSQAMSNQSRELVRLGMLSEEAARRWDGAYLPRFYESKLRPKADAWADAVRQLIGRPAVMKGIKGKHLKGRGLYETVPEVELPHYEAMGWEVRDPDYQRSLPTVDGTVQVWRDFTREERERMGEIRDAGFRFVMGYMQTQRDIALGRMFEALATDPATSSRTPREGWLRVPDSTVEGTGAARYGKLAGRYVPAEVLSHLSSIEEAQSAAWTMYRKALGWWKMGKTAMNPVSHANNVLSNLTMAHFAGVGYHRADKYLGALRDFITKPAMLQEAKDNGLFGATMNAEELVKDLPPALRQLAMKAESKLARGAKLTFDILTFFLRKPMGAAYEFEDLFFRYLIYKDARGRGLDPQDAVDQAQRFIFTYDDLPKGARYVRDFGIPFFSYTYKAIPALLHTALVYPWRFAAPAGVLWAANAMAYAIATDDDDTWQEALQKYLNDPEFRARVREKEQSEREHLPPWMKGTTSLATPKAIRLGEDEVTKLPLFIDVARIIPGGDIFDVTPNAGGVPLPQPITPSHPLFSLATAMIANRDTWTGKDLVDKNDTRGEAAQKRADWIWKQFAPAVAVGNAHWERGMNALAQATGESVRWTAVLPDGIEAEISESIARTYTGVGRDKQPAQPKYAAMQTFGIKVRPVDLELSAVIDKTQREKLIRDIDAEIRQLRRQAERGAISDKALESEIERAVEKKDRLRQGLTVDGDQRE